MALALVPAIELTGSALPAAAASRRPAASARPSKPPTAAHHHGGDERDGKPIQGAQRLRPVFDACPAAAPLISAVTASAENLLFDGGEPQGRRLRHQWLSTRTGYGRLPTCTCA